MKAVVTHFIILISTLGIHTFAHEPTIALKTSFLFDIPCKNFSFQDSDYQAICCAAVSDSLIVIQTGRRNLSVYSYSGVVRKIITHEISKPASYLRYNPDRATFSYLSLDQECRKREIVLYQLDTNGFTLSRRSFQFYQLDKALIAGGFISASHAKVLQASVSYPPWSVKNCSSMVKEPLYNYMATLRGNYAILGRVWTKGTNTKLVAQDTIIFPNEEWSAGSYVAYDCESKTPIEILDYWQRKSYLTPASPNICSGWPYDSKARKMQVSPFTDGSSMIQVIQHSGGLRVLHSVIVSYTK